MKLQEKTLNELLKLKELNYRGYLTDKQYIEKVNETLDKYVQEYNEKGDK